MSRTRVLAGGIAAGLVALLATAVPASAHDDLISSDPPADAVLETAPERITLTFSGELLDLGSAIVVADATGEDWTSGDPVLDGTDISVPVEPGMADAGYEIRWRVVSSDGHPIAGAIPFVIGDGTPLVRDDDGAGSTEATPAAAPDAPDAQTDDDGGGPGRVLAVGTGGALLALAVLFLFTRLRRRDIAAAPDDAADVPPSDTPERH